MIIEQAPLTMAEVAELAGDSEKELGFKTFIKKFVSMDAERAREMKKEIENLKLLKLKQEYIVKIIDFMPEDAVDLNKVLQDASLDQDEINKITEIVKKY